MGYAQDVLINRKSSRVSLCLALCTEASQSGRGAAWAQEYCADTLKNNTRPLNARTKMRLSRCATKGTMLAGAKPARRRRRRRR